MREEPRCVSEDGHAETDQHARGRHVAEFSGKGEDENEGEPRRHEKKSGLRWRKILNLLDENGQ